MRSSILATALAVGLAGCMNAYAERPDYPRGDLVTELAGLAPDGVVAVELHGVLPGYDTGRVARAMTGRDTGGRLRFVPGIADGRSIRVVLAAQGPAGLDGRDLCRGALETGGPAWGNELRMSAAFCDGAQVVSETRGFSPDADDPVRTEALLGVMTAALFPSAGQSYLSRCPTRYYPYCLE